MTLTLDPVVEAPVVPQTKTYPDVLRHAALIIEERGWHQGHYISGDGKVCALGAIVLALGGSFDATGGPKYKSFTDYAQASEMVSDYLTGGGPIYGVADWNDRQGRTAAQVTAALRAAAG